VAGSLRLISTEFLEAESTGHTNLEILRHDITVEDLPGGFDLVHARWLIEWLPDKRLALKRMIAALRPRGVLLDEEPDWVNIFNAAKPTALRHVITAGMRHLESTCPIETEYGRRLLDDLIAVGLVAAEAEGRCPVVRGGSPPAAHFLRLTLEKLKSSLLVAGAVSESEFAEAVAALENPAVTVVMPMTVAAWGWSS
jgi:SAM-dependent methyltransferase